MGEQENFNGREVLDHASNKRAQMPDDRTRRLLTNIAVDFSPIGNELHFDGSVKFNPSELSDDRESAMIVEHDDFKDIPIKPESKFLKRFRNVATASSAAIVAALAIDSTIPAMAEIVSESELTPVVSKIVTPEPTTAVEPAPTIAYGEREAKIAENRLFFESNGCLPENLDFCARVRFSLQNSNGFTDTRLFEHPERTVLSNYLTDDDLVEFGKTGKSDVFDVIYFKDKDGNTTNIPALMYLGVSDWNVGVGQLQEAIDLWENGIPGFLENLYEYYDVSVFIQSKAGDKPGASGKFGDGIVLFNCGQIDKDVKGNGNFVRTIAFMLPAEAIGNHLEQLAGDDTEYAESAGPLKGVFAAALAECAFIKTDDEFYSDAAGYYNAMANDYFTMLCVTIDDFSDILEKIKSENLVYVPNGAWEKIDALTAN